MTQNAGLNTAKGIARSLRIYHRDAARTQAMDALNAQFCAPGALVFDVGAHVGDRVASFRRLGASVVAVEPQPAAMRALRLMYRRDAAVTLEQVAVGGAQGTVALHLNTRNPTVSTASAAFIAAAADAPGWEGQEWDRVIEVPMLTLDDLIARHGVPDFIKIDVEGFEAEVLSGLSHRIKALSFEFTTIQRDSAVDALHHLARLSGYIFNLSFGENHRLEREAWLNVDDMRNLLQSMPGHMNAGDIYARLA